MACSKYEYVKKFQDKTVALLQTYIVVRIDGRGFTKFCNAHKFKKPNDLRAIKLMNAAAEYVCSSFTQIFLAYGQSDEYSFVFNKNTTLFSRRTDKILSCLVSAFTAGYMFNWGKHFEMEMAEIPTFDSRIVLYPNQAVLKDYFKWRQVDCHINNLYNTVFWEMVGTGKSHQEVENILKDTNSGQKNQILFGEFGINYNQIQEVYRRGTLFYYVVEKQILSEEGKKELASEVKSGEGKKTEEGVKELASEAKQEEKMEQKQEGLEGEKEKEKGMKQKPKKGDKMRRKLIASHEDLIREQFWVPFFSD